VRSALILDGTLGTAAQQAQALSGFVCQGLAGDPPAETLVFYQDERDKDRLVELSPTRDVRLIRTTARRPDRMIEILAALAHDKSFSLFLFARGPQMTEAATRLACRTGGAVMTEALSIEATGERFTRPWFVTIDDARKDGRSLASLDHRVVSDTDEREGTSASPFEDLEIVDLPASGDLAECRFLVVAGAGAGSRQGVERIAAAARRMGAAFGTTRPVAMNAWAPMDRLVGVSGARTAPAVCIVVGASGAPALHWAIERAAFIAAVNLDEQAPIVGNADAVILDDGVTILEELAKVVSARDRQG
jgi:electron transfer flavoprotein alpha subunit